MSPTDAVKSQKHTAACPYLGRNFMRIHFTQRALKLALVSAFAVGSSAIGINGYATTAATATADLSVTATVVANCLISTTAVNFGDYDPISANASANLDAQGIVSTTCTAGSSPTITLAQGTNPAAGSTAAAPLRQMATGSNRLSYHLYSDPGRTAVWGDTGVATPVQDGATPKINTVYGRIPLGQIKPVGTYADVVTATVAF
jgi:spore coat protein U-like protein